MLSGLAGGEQRQELKSHLSQVVRVWPYLLVGLILLFPIIFLVYNGSFIFAYGALLVAAATIRGGTRYGALTSTWLLVVIYLAVAFTPILLDPLIEHPIELMFSIGVVYYFISIGLGQAIDRAHRKNEELALRLSELHTARNQLLDSEARFRSVFNQSPIAIVIFDIDGARLTVNTSAAEYLKNAFLPPDESYNLFQHSSLSLADAELLRKGEIVNFEVDLPRPVASQSEPGVEASHLHCTAHPLRTKVGGCSGYVLQIVNDTERRRAELALQEANDQLIHWVKALERNSQELALLNEMGDLLQSCATTNEAYSLGARTAQLLFPAEAGALYAIDRATDKSRLVDGWGEIDQWETGFGPGDCWAIQNGKPYLSRAPKCPVCTHHRSSLPEIHHLCVPLLAGGETLGLLVMRSTVGEALEEGSVVNPIPSLAVTVAEHIALAASNIILRETLRDQAIRDSLTGLFNRRYMEETLERELRRERRRGAPLGLIMLDIDLFKDYNDRYGHDAGDYVLRELGSYLHTHIRSEDVACRYGGEEFVLIMPETSIEVAVDRANRLREGIKRMALSYESRTLGQLTVSLGVALSPDHGETAQTVLRAADLALLRAKAQGRDHVEVAPFNSL